MRLLGLTCTAFVLTTLPVVAQQPVAAPAPAPTQPSPERLDQLLDAWEQRMSAIETLSTRTTRTDTSPLTKKSTIFAGEAAFMKPNLARIDLTHQDDVGKPDAQKTNFERIMCNGQHIFEYRPKEKLIVVHEMPKNNESADNMILAFLRGMKAADAKKRFGLALTKETEWYGYLMIAPKTDADKQEFTAAQLTIWIKNPNQQGQPNVTMMPCRLWYREPNGREVTYMFTDMQPNAKLGQADFVARQIQGYETKMASALASPTPPAPMPKAPTIRPQGPAMP